MVSDPRMAELKDAATKARADRDKAAIRVAERALEGKSHTFTEMLDYQQARHKHRLAVQELDKYLCDPDRIWKAYKANNQ